MDVSDKSDITICDHEELQGDVVPGFRKDHRMFLFVRVEDPEQARPALARLADRVATCGEVLQFNRLWRRLRQRRGEETDPPLAATWLNVAFARSGLSKLGVEGFGEGLARQSFERGVEAVTGPLSAGDVALSSDLVISIAGDRTDMVKEEVDSVGKLLMVQGMVEIGRFEGHALIGEDGRQREHFGFQDGISISAVAGLDEDQQSVSSDKRSRPLPVERIVVAADKPAETRRNRPDANGSYLVLLKIEQDVEAFWRFCTEGAARLNADWQTDNNAVPMAGRLTPEDFAALLIGRRLDGTPLAKYPITVSAPAQPQAREDLDDFDYQEDVHGRMCPLGAHIRKMNPRALPEDHQRADIHAIMRRSIPYDVNGERGLLFVCYQSSLSDGFEYVQVRWADAPLSSTEDRLDAQIDAQIAVVPAGRDLNDAIDYPALFAKARILPIEAPGDPIVGRPGRDGLGSLEFPRPQPLGGSTGIPLFNRWVTYRDGNYFFVPSLSTLRQWVGG